MSHWAERGASDHPFGASVEGLAEPGVPGLSIRDACSGMGRRALAVVASAMTVDQRTDCEISIVDGWPSSSGGLSDVISFEC